MANRTRERDAEYHREMYHERGGRERQLARRYGISVEQYEEMLQRQGGVCAICEQECPRGALCVDHDHETGRVRGLLCRKCNRGLGLVELHFDRARRYLSGS